MKIQRILIAMNPIIYFIQLKTIDTISYDSQLIYKKPYLLP